MSHASRRGFFLVWSLLVVAGLTAVTAAGLNRSSTEHTAASRFIHVTQAFSLAEAGLDCAARQFRTTNSNATIAATCSVSPVSWGTVTVTIDPPPAGSDLRFLTCTGRVTSTDTQSVLRATLRRTTLSPFQQAVYGARQIGTGTGVAVMSGALLDSYDSRLGAYGGANVGSQADVRTNSTYNNPWTDKAIAVAFGGAQIRGSAYAPAGGGIFQEIPGTSITGTVGLQPQMESFAAPVPPVAPTLPAGCTNLGNLLVDGGDVIRTESVLCADSITVTNGHTLSLPNVQTLYITGDTVVSGGGALVAGQGSIRTANLTVRNAGSAVRVTNDAPLVHVTGATDLRDGGALQMGSGTLNTSSLYMNYNTGLPGGVLESTTGTIDVYTGFFRIDDASRVFGPQNQPDRVRLYATSTLPSIISDGSSVYGTIYATAGQVTVRGASTSMYGAIIGDWCSISAGRLHYDQGLAVATGWPNWITAADVDLLAQY
jgi:Tfp pilus assembly protein PilX